MTTDVLSDAAKVAPQPPYRRPIEWPLSWVRTVALILVLCFVAGVIGWRLGRTAAPSFNNVDVGFLDDMTQHHNGAIVLAFAYLARGNDPTLTSMAHEIIVDQAQEISGMSGLLARAGNPSTVGDGISMDWMGHPVVSARMPGLATNADYAKLRAANPEAASDQFSRLMIRHHKAGIEMADYAARYGANSDVKRLAKAMAKAQRFEVFEMNLRRVALGLKPVHPPTLIGTHL